MKYLYYHPALSIFNFPLLSLLTMSFRMVCFLDFVIFLAIFSLNSAFPPLSLISPLWTSICISPVLLFFYNVKHIYFMASLWVISFLQPLWYYSPVSFIRCFPSCEPSLVLFVFFDCELIFNGVFSPWGFGVSRVVESGFILDSAEALRIWLTQAI